MCGCKYEMYVELYKKFSPDQVDKVEGLMAKAGDDVKKFSALLNKFVAKFPQVSY
jgi:hypothetical protein